VKNLLSETMCEEEMSSVAIDEKPTEATDEALLYYNVL